MIHIYILFLFLKMLGAEYNQQINFPNETCPICEFLIKEVSKWISYNG